MLLVELLTVVVLIVVNGLLAMSEMAIVSSRISRLNSLAERQVPGARRALVLASDSGKFLSSVQIGITLVGVLSGAVSGATLGLRLSGWLITTGMGERWAESLGVGAVVIAITYASLIVGELVPKQIALRNPEAIAVRVAPAMAILARITAPMVWLLDFSGKAILAVLGQGGARDGTVTEDEIKTLAAEAEQFGVLEPGDTGMITGVLRLGDRNVQVVMTPRNEVDTLDTGDDVATLLSTLQTSPHSRFPVYDNGSSDVLGVVRAVDALNAYIAQGAAFQLRDHIRHAPIIPDTTDARDVLAALKAAPIHMGLVHDEYGHFLGVVTTADILESIVGGFTTDEGPAEPSAVRREDGSYLISGRMPMDEFYELTGIMPAADHGYHTVAGFVLSGFGRLPNTGDYFEIAHWRFEVVDMDGRRIDKILAARRR